MLMPQMIDTLNRNHAAIGHKPDDFPEYLQSAEAQPADLFAEAS